MSNRLSKKVDAGNDGRVEQTIDYAYNARDRLTGEDHDGDGQYLHVIPRTG